MIRPWVLCYWLVLSVTVLLAGCSSQNRSHGGSVTGVSDSAGRDSSISSTGMNSRLPVWLKGNFVDDYGIRYEITDTMFQLGSSARYHVLRFDDAEQFLITRNDAANPGEAGLYTRIDVMQFQGMAPFKWGFCLTRYDAPDTATAVAAKPADRLNPKKGCNGFPFSRMKRI